MYDHSREPLQHMTTLGAFGIYDHSRHHCHQVNNITVPIHILQLTCCSRNLVRSIKQTFSSFVDFIYISYSLSQIEFRFFSTLNSLYLHQRLLMMDVSFSSTETNKYTFAIQPIYMMKGIELTDSQHTITYLVIAKLSFDAHEVLCNIKIQIQRILLVIY